MEAFHFTEMPYPYVPDDYFERYGSGRVTLPNHLFDPKVGRELYKSFFEQYEYADHLGYNIMLNEHHQTITCIDTIISVSAAALAHRTENAKILLLGHPLPARESPVRVAEETAMLDVISGGRILCGFVRGVPSEVHPSNANPALNKERFEEAHDLIIKAWTTPEPFAWEGKHFHYRYVNIWPQPYQQPHPPVWVSGIGTVSTIELAAERGYTYAIFLAPHDLTAKLYDVYRTRARETGRPEPGSDKFAYLAAVFVGETDEEAQRLGRGLEWYFTAKQARGFWFPPGHSPVEPTKKGWTAATKGAVAGGAKALSWQDYQDAGIVIIGNPDTVRQKIRKLYDETGCGNLLMMMHAGIMSNDVTMKSMKLFAEEILPAIREFEKTPPAGVRS